MLKVDEDCARNERERGRERAIKWRRERQQQVRHLRKIRRVIRRVVWWNIADAGMKHRERVKWLWRFSPRN